MRVLTASVLVFEIILISLFVPTYLAFDLANANTITLISVFTIVVALLATATLRKPIGIYLGWAVQALLFVLGAIVRPGFFMAVVWILALIFTILWFLAIRLGRKFEVEKS